jgi:tetratricopeptide (TPR) repeat protein
MTTLESLRRFFAKRSAQSAGIVAKAPSGRPLKPSEHARGSASNLLREAEDLLAQGEHQEALAVFQAVVDQSDRSAAGHYGQARAYLALGQHEEAADSLEVALAIDPAYIDALVLLAKIRRETGAVDESVALLGRARCIAPQNASILADLASALTRCGDIPEAIAIYDEAIRVAPSDARPKVNLGLVYLLQLGNPTLAESYFRAVLADWPDHLEASANLGLALRDQERHEEEFAIYRQALSVHPESTELRWNQALANLSAGNFREGWRGYEFRFSRHDGRNLRRYGFPLWDGSPMPDNRLLVLAEQGLGDEIMFASCVPELRAMVKGVVLECSPRLAALFARSFPWADVYGRERHASLDWLQRYPDLSAQVPIGSLPMWLRPGATSFPKHNGYLRIDPMRVAAYRDQLVEAGRPLTVGISWRGGTGATGKALRSIALTELKRFLPSDRVRYACLQHQLNKEEREIVQDLGWFYCEEAFANIDELAALTASLDLVITVANLNLHVAGALGRSAWGLLGMSPDWRWLRHGASSLWYPSIQLFRAREYGGWESMLRDVAMRLQLRAAASS